VLEEHTLTTLDSGVRVVSEKLPTVRSIAVGLWIRVGSRDEAHEQAGISHFLEHMLFKGTPELNAEQIAQVFDAFGADVNAATSKEATVLHAHFLDEHFDEAFKVMSDMFLRSTYADLESEREVVLEEIAMYEDEPHDKVHDVISTAVFGDHPLGRPVIGRDEVIAGLTKEDVSAYHDESYRPRSIVVAAAGNLDHAKLLGLVKRALGSQEEAAPTSPRVAGRPPAFRTTVAVHRRPTEQANLVLGTRGLHRTDDRRFALGVLNGALGGGMSSRLFQEVREKRGLAYSVYSYTSQYADTGIFGIYAGCLPGKIDQVLAICREQLAAVADRGISDAEILRGKGQLRGSLVLGLEDTGSRMSRLGKSELVYGELLTVEEILARIDAVTPDEVRSVARQVLEGPLSLSVIGPFDDHDFTSVVAA
jgi:predicted Zn-dependent peptidase